MEANRRIPFGQNADRDSVASLCREYVVQVQRRVGDRQRKNGSVIVQQDLFRRQANASILAFKLALAGHGR